jgi:hypothetical protein
VAEGSDLESRRTREGPVGSNPTSSASATSTFMQFHDRWSALGPLPLRQCGHAGLLQAVGQGLHLGGEQVPVGVQSDARGRMAQLRLDRLELAPWAISNEAQACRRSYSRRSSGRPAARTAGCLHGHLRRHPVSPRCARPLTGRACEGPPASAFGNSLATRLGTSSPSSPPPSPSPTPPASPWTNWLGR